MEVKLKKVARVIATPYSTSGIKVDCYLYECIVKVKEYIQKGDKLFPEEKVTKFMTISVLCDFTKVTKKELKELILSYSLKDITECKTPLETDIQEWSRYFSDGYFEPISVYDDKYNQRCLVFRDGELL
jgi:hypothetical protein